MPSTGGSDPNGGGDSGVGGAASGAGASGAGGSAGNSGTGDGYGPDGMVGLGDEMGGYSSVDENGKFTGVVDADLGFMGTVTANMATNFGIAMSNISDSSTFGKLGLAATALSNPGLTALAGLAMGVKSVAQALATPGLTAEDTEAISSAASTISTMTPAEQATLASEASAMADGGSVSSTWDTFVDEFVSTDEGSAIISSMIAGQDDYKTQKLQDFDDATVKQTGLLDSLIDQSQTGTGLFSPVKFTLAGDEVAFVPKAQREQASQEALFGQERVGNFGNLYTAALADKTLSANMADADANREASEPGLLDWIKGIGTAAETGKSIYDMFG